MNDSFTTSLYKAAACTAETERAAAQPSSRATVRVVRGCRCCFRERELLPVSDYRIAPRLRPPIHPFLRGATSSSQQGSSGTMLR
ncbi:hypothetical protein AOLI_G00302220 [Acnodon oligacanthus]